MTLAMRADAAHGGQRAAGRTASPGVDGSWLRARPGLGPDRDLSRGQPPAAAPDLEAGFDVQPPPARADPAHALGVGDQRSESQVRQSVEGADPAELDVVPGRAGVVIRYPVGDVNPPATRRRDPRALQPPLAPKPHYQFGTVGLAGGHPAGGEP